VKLWAVDTVDWYVIGYELFHDREKAEARRAVLAEEWKNRYDIEVREVETEDDPSPTQSM
jgi:hypothetical protein